MKYALNDFFIYHNPRLRLCTQKACHVQLSPEVFIFSFACYEE
jgi:hypothetical protein